MKDEYDFSNAEQGKFCVSQEEMEIPIYLDKDVAQFLNEKAKGKKESIQMIVNELLRKDIEIAKKVLA